MKELPPRETKDNTEENLQKFQDGRAVYAVHHTANESLERLRFSEENNVSPAIAVPQCVVGMQLICGRGEGDVIEVFEDHREQIEEYEIWGGGGTPLNGLYKHVRPQRVWVFSRFGHK